MYKGSKEGLKHPNVRGAVVWEVWILIGWCPDYTFTDEGTDSSGDYGQKLDLIIVLHSVHQVHQGEVKLVPW